MNKLQANLCLLCVTLLWSTEVIIFAVIPDSVEPFATTAITSLIGGALLCLCFFKRIKAALKSGGGFYHLDDGCYPACYPDDEKEKR